MNFLSIPEEVIEGCLLPYLKWNDLLRFRKVCKATKEITQRYMKVHPEVAPEIEIVEDDAKRSFRAFLKMNIPTSKIFLNNQSGYWFYGKDGKNVSRFLKKCGPAVKHLRVKELSLYVHGKEWDFMEALVNLQSFEAEYFGVGNKSGSPADFRRALSQQIDFADQDPRYVNQDLPSILWNLKSLKIGQQIGVAIANVTARTAGFLMKGHNLEHASLPFCPQNLTSERFLLPEDYQPELAMALAFQMINIGIQDKPNFKTFDFCCYYDPRVGDSWNQMHADGSGMFLELLRTCTKNNVQLLNVAALWFTEWGDHPEINSPDLGIPVLSLVNLNPCILPVNMPNLETIEIRTLSQSSPGPHWRQQRPDWPALKKVDITADCNRISVTLVENGNRIKTFFQDAKEIFQFFFQDIRRINLTEIRLRFAKDQVSIPKTDEIVESCPNLKKITLINWPGKNKALIHLWDGLPALEEVSLESCSNVGNVTFVGVDAKDPVFFKLKKLRKLSLKGLDQMPKITDLLFSLVLRHLNLTHLTLTSDRPLKSVTSAGINSLLEGKFSEKVEKFPFQDWSLEGVPVAEFKKMEAKFRSFKML